MGYLGIIIGMRFGVDILMYLFGMVGVLSPVLYVLEKIYKEIRSKN